MRGKVGTAVTAGVALPLGMFVTADAASVRVRCEKRADRSKISVDGNDLAAGSYKARATSGGISVNAHRLRSLVVVRVLQAALPGAEALALVARGAEPIEVREGRVTAVIVESPLPTLLRAIARQSGIDIVLHASLEGTVSVTFRDVPLEEALRRILRTTNAVFIYSQRSAAHVGAPPARAGVPQARLSEVHIYPGSTSVAASAPVVVRDAEPTTASMTTRSRLTAEATKNLLGNRSRISQKRAATTLGRTYDAKNVGRLAQALREAGDASRRPRAAM